MDCAAGLYEPGSNGSAVQQAGHPHPVRRRVDSAVRDRFIVELYAAHARVVRAYIACNLRGSDEVEDVLQDLFLRIVRLDDPFKLKENPRGYLFQVARNLIRDRARHARYCRHDFHEDIDGLTIEADGPSPEYEAARKSDMAQLLAVLSPDKRTRNVVILSLMEDLTYPEIAERLCVTTRTIERCMQRARQICQKHIDPTPLVAFSGTSSPRKQVNADSA